MATELTLVLRFEDEVPDNEALEIMLECVVIEREEEYV